MLMIPKINGKVLSKEDPFILKDKFKMNQGEFHEALVEVFLNRVKDNCRLIGEITNDDHCEIMLCKDSSYDKEAYAIEVNAEGIRLYASNDVGIIWAMATTYQMVVEAQKNNHGMLQGGVLTDSPKYAHRGLLVDVCRHFFDMVEIKRIIEEMSVYKLNIFHWHITEDQAWRIESKRFPRLNEVGSNGNYYTQEQIRELVEFARVRGVEIIPEIDIPGHTSAAIAAYPELSCFDEEIQVPENPGIYKTIMCAGKETTYEWIFNILDEIIELFPSNTIHLGGDEAPKDKWRECPHCNAFMNKHDIKNHEDLQGAFTARISEYLKAKGKKMICWNESLKAANFSNDIAIQYWLEAAAESYVYPAFEKGQPMIFSNLFHMYFDYPTCIVTLKKTYEFEPTIMGNRSLKGEHILGMEGAIWTESVPTNELLENMISLRIQALAEAAWTVDRDYETFLVRLKAHYTELGLVKLNSMSFEQAAVSGEEAEIQAIAFLQGFVANMKTSEVDLGMSQEELKGMLMMFIFQIFEGEAAMEVAQSFELM